MIHLQYRGAGFSPYYSPDEICNCYKSIIDSDNIIDSKQISVAGIVKNSKGYEHAFRSSLVQDILTMLEEIDSQCIVKMPSNALLIGCNITQNQYSKILLSKQNMSYIKSLYDIQRMQFELFCSIYLTEPALHWFAYYVNLDFFNYSQILDDLLKSPLGIERIQNLANQYVDSKIQELMYYNTIAIKGFSYSYDDMKIKKRWRLKNAKKNYLKYNPYFKKW